MSRDLAVLRSRARARIALENDDGVHTALDLLPLCREEGILLVHDLHHHRCDPDGLSVEEAAVAGTWERHEPWAHLPTENGGWRGDDPRPDAEPIHPRDVRPAGSGGA